MIAVLLSIAFFLPYCAMAADTTGSDGAKFSEMQTQKQLPSPPRMGVAKVNKAVVQHITILWLKEPQNADHLEKAIAGIRLLAKIPGVKSVTIGNAIPAERNPSDQSKSDASFDLAVVITLENEDFYASYIKHPIHDSIARSTLAPLLASYKMYDVYLAE